MGLALQMQAGTSVLKKTAIADNRSGCICYSLLCKAALCATVCVVCPNSPEISLQTSFSHRFTAGRSFEHQRAENSTSEPAPCSFSTTISASSLSLLLHLSGLDYSLLPKRFWFVLKSLVLISYRLGLRLWGKNSSISFPCHFDLQRQQSSHRHRRVSLQL